MLSLISISFVPSFPFPLGYLYSCYVPAVTTPCPSLQTFSCLSMWNSTFCSTFCSYIALLRIPEAWISHPESTSHCMSLCRLRYIKSRLLLQVSHLRSSCPSQSTGEALLNSFALQIYPYWRIKTFCIRVVAFVASQVKQD